MATAQERPRHILEVASLTVDFGGVRALDGLSLALAEGEVVAIVGPNGSGKTTACNAISGRVRPTAGTIRFLGEEIQARAPHAICRRGIVRTFQEVRVFRKFTLLENLRFALRDVSSETVVGALWPWRRSDGAASDQAAEKWLEMIGLWSKRDTLAGELSFGQGKLLEIARAACQRPCLILLDEPGAGLSPEGLGRLRRVLEDLRGSGTTVAFIEHDLAFVTEFADRMLVLCAGRLLGSAAPRDRQAADLLNRAYSEAAR